MSLDRNRPKALMMVAMVAVAAFIHNIPGCFTTVGSNPRRDQSKHPHGRGVHPALLRRGKGKR